MKKLADLEELVLEIRSPYTRDYVDEAVRSYEAGAYRACVATLWVAVCIDIIEKVRELSAAGDAEARIIETTLESIDFANKPGMQKFEQDLLEHACGTLEILSPIEKSQIERLKEDRNICVHPTFQKEGRHFEIEPEIARAHIVNAHRFLFSVAPTRGKVFVGVLFELITEKSFPKDREKARAILSTDSYLKRAKNSVFRNLSIVLLKSVFGGTGGVSKELVARASAGLYAISAINPRVFDNTMTEVVRSLLSQATDKQLARVFPVLSVFPEFWVHLEQGTRLRISSLLDTMSVAEIINYKVVEASSSIQSLGKNLGELVQSFDNDQLAEMAEAFPSKFTKDFAITEFLESWSFASAKANGEKYLLPHAQFFKQDDVKRILDETDNNNSPGINQIINAAGIDEIFAQLYTNTKNNHLGSDSYWKDFWGRLDSKQGSFEELGTLLSSNGVIEIELESGDDEDVDEIPF